MRVLCVFALLLHTATSIKLSDEWVVRESDEIFSDLSKPCPITVDGIKKMQEQMANPYSLLYGTLARFYMQAVPSLAVKYPDEMKAASEEKAKFEELFKGNVSEAKLTMLKYAANIANFTITNLDDAELYNVRSHIFQTTDIIDGNEVLDYQSIFSPRFFNTLVVLPKNILKFFDKIVEEYKANWKEVYRDQPANATLVEEFEDGMNSDVEQLKLEHFVHPVNLTLPITLLKLVHLAPKYEVGNATVLLDIFPESEGDFGEFNKNLTELLPKSVPLCQKINAELEQQAQKVLRDLMGVLEKSRTAIKGQDATLDSALNAANGKITENMDELRQNLTWHLKSTVHREILTLLDTMSPGERRSVRKFVGVLARFMLRQQLRKGGYRFWSALKTTTPNIQILTNTIKEAFSNVTANVRESAKTLLPLAKEKVKNDEFWASVGRLASVLDAKMAGLTQMQSMKVHLAYPVPILLLINDIPDRELEFFRSQKVEEEKE
ncbi:unnamed protein product, partial [Mesorhabditis spiculigera]